MDEVIWVFEKMIGPILGAVGLALVAWVRDLGRRLRNLAAAAADAEAMIARFEAQEARILRLEDEGND